LQWFTLICGADLWFWDALGMMCGKCFGILIEGEGEGGAQGAPIAVIASHRRDRKTKTYRGLSADQEWGWKAESYANLCPSTRKPRVDGARL